MILSHPIPVSLTLIQWSFILKLIRRKWVIRKVHIAFHYFPGGNIFFAFIPIFQTTAFFFLIKFWHISESSWDTHFLLIILQVQLNPINIISVRYCASLLAFSLFVVHGPYKRRMMYESIYFWYTFRELSWFHFFKVYLRGTSGRQDPSFNMLVREGTSNIRFWINVWRESLRYIFQGSD